MENLQIEIDGATFTAKKPKARIWAKMAEFDENKSKLPASEFIDAHAEIIADIFPELDKDFILDNVDLDDILAIYYKSFLWVTQLITSKLDKVANVKNAGGDTE